MVSELTSLEHCMCFLVALCPQVLLLSLLTPLQLLFSYISLCTVLSARKPFFRRSLHSSLSHAGVKAPPPADFPDPAYLNQQPWWLHTYITIFLPSILHLALKKKKFSPKDVFIDCRERGWERDREKNIDR